MSWLSITHAYSYHSVGACLPDRQLVKSLSVPHSWWHPSLNLSMLIGLRPDMQLAYLVVDALEVIDWCFGRRWLMLCGSLIDALEVVDWLLLSSFIGGHWLVLWRSMIDALKVVDWCFGGSWLTLCRSLIDPLEVNDWCFGGRWLIDSFRGVIVLKVCAIEGRVDQPAVKHWHTS